MVDFPLKTCGKIGQNTHHCTDCHWDFMLVIYLEGMPDLFNNCQQKIEIRAMGGSDRLEEATVLIEKNVADSQTQHADSHLQYILKK